MRNVNVLILAAAISVAAGCNAPTSPEAAQAPIAPPPTQAVQQAPQANADFPEGISPDFKFKIRSRGSEAADGEGSRRKLFVEFKEGDVAVVDQKLQALLEQKGYKRYKDFKNGDSRVGDYGKPGRRVTVTTSPAGELKLDSDSLGTVYMIWTE